MTPNQFSRLYNFLFPKYKSVVRFGYSTKLIFYSIMGNREMSAMAAAIYRVMPYTLVGIGGLEATYRLARLANEREIPGAFVELGVARGGAAALLAGVAFDQGSKIERKVWLFDSFEGLPEPTKDDFQANGESGAITGHHVRPLPKGSCLGQLEEVQHLMFQEFAFPRNRVELVKGWFQDTLPLRGKEIGAIAVLRIDGDWYESTKCCLENLYDQVTRGGVVIVDDYKSCFGCEKAVDEFLARRGLAPRLELDGRGGCYFFKM